MNYETEQEISLHDIWQTFTKHKKVFWITFSIIFGLGAIYATLVSKHYNYTQIVQLASYKDESGKSIPLCSFDSISEKITTNYIPKTIFNYNQAHGIPFSVSPEDFTVSKIDETSFSIAFKSSLKKANVYAELLQSILSKIDDDTVQAFNQRSDYLRGYLQGLVKLKEKLFDNFKVPIELIKSKNQISSSENRVLSIVLLQNLSEYGSITADLEKSFAAIQYQQNSLEKTNSNQANLVRSVIPIGPARSVLVILSLIIGLIISFFVVFVAEFIGKINNTKLHN